jgi:hypothetical protein
MSEWILRLAAPTHPNRSLSRIDDRVIVIVNKEKFIMLFTNKKAKMITTVSGHSLV